MFRLYLKPKSSRSPYAATGVTKGGKNWIYFWDRFFIVDINQEYVINYTEIDAYSQLLNPAFKEYPFRTPRNMGKNDLWIASLASFLSLKLVTTDADFDHLNEVFIETNKIQIDNLLPLLK